MLTETLVGKGTQAMMEASLLWASLLPHTVRRLKHVLPTSECLVPTRTEKMHVLHRESYDYSRPAQREAWFTVVHGNLMPRRKVPTKKNNSKETNTPLTGPSEGQVPHSENGVTPHAAWTEGVLGRRAETGVKQGERKTSWISTGEEETKRLQRMNEKKVTLDVVGNLCA